MPSVASAVHFFELADVLHLNSAFSDVLHDMILKSPKRIEEKQSSTTCCICTHVSAISFDDMLLRLHIAFNKQILDKLFPDHAHQFSENKGSRPLTLHHAKIDALEGLLGPAKNHLKGKLFMWESQYSTAGTTLCAALEMDSKESTCGILHLRLAYTWSASMHMIYCGID